MQCLGWDLSSRKNYINHQIKIVKKEQFCCFKATSISLNEPRNYWEASVVIDLLWQSNWRPDFTNYNYYTVRSWIMTRVLRPLIRLIKTIMHMRSYSRCTFVYLSDLIFLHVRSELMEKFEIVIVFLWLKKYNSAINFDKSFIGHSSLTAHFFLPANYSIFYWLFFSRCIHR